MTVFDFDKTLTDYDTLFGFYRMANKNDAVFQMKRFLLLSFAIGTKLKLFSNSQLKKCGVALFLKGKSEKELENAARQYADKIELNSIYKKDFLDCPKHERIIISASYEIYLKKLFPGEKIIGSRLAYKQQKVKGVERTIFGKNKTVALGELGIDEIECLYTDSFSDRPLMDIAKQVYLVNKASKKKIK